jgi:hypothetical protein
MDGGGIAGPDDGFKHSLETIEKLRAIKLGPYLKNTGSGTRAYARGPRPAGATPRPKGSGPPRGPL